MRIILIAGFILYSTNCYASFSLQKSLPENCRKITPDITACDDRDRTVTCYTTLSNNINSSPISCVKISAHD